MITNFNTLSGFTVSNNYSWDEGVPFGGSENSLTAADIDTETGYISGYAPALKVYFQNSSLFAAAPFNSVLYTDFAWSFGDEYNSLTNNVALSCFSPVWHTYVMPGKYSVSLQYTRAVSQQVINLDETLCFGKYNINWYWDKLADPLLNVSAFNAENFGNTWNETACNEFFEKWWDDEFACYQKYCKFWSWNDLQSIKNSNVTWEQAQTGGTFEKKWMREENDTSCSTNAPAFFTVQETPVQQTITKQFLVEVLELPPQAGLHCVTDSLTGYSPYTVRLSPQASKCGSFPIDRIDWNFGDGSPIKTVVRQNCLFGTQLSSEKIVSYELTASIVNYELTASFIENLQNITAFYDRYEIIDNAPLSANATITYQVTLTSERPVVTQVYPMPDLIYNGSYFSDLQDPRNYDVEHTYYRNAETYSVFYPSITAYSANTGTYDSCSTTIGPLLLAKTEKATPVKVINNQKETIYAFNINDACALFTTLTSLPSVLTINIPQHKLKNDKNVIIMFNGNDGSQIVEETVPNCEGFEFVPIATALLTEQSVLTSFAEITAIAQENNDFLFV